VSASLRTALPKRPAAPARATAIGLAVTIPLLGVWQVTCLPSAGHQPFAQRRTIPRPRKRQKAGQHHPKAGSGCWSTAATFDTTTSPHPVQIRALALIEPIGLVAETATPVSPQVLVGKH